MDNNMTVKIKNSSFDFEITGTLHEIKEVLIFLRENDLLTISDANYNSLSRESLESQTDEASDELPIKATNRTKQRNSYTGKKIDSFNFSEKFNEVNFVDEYSKYKVRGFKSQIFVLLQIYKNMTGEREFNESLIHSLLDKVGIDTPKSLPAMLNNYMNRDKLLEKTDLGYKLKYIGEDFAKKLMIIEEN
jgi:hypothetical protein